MGARTGYAARDSCHRSVLLWTGSRRYSASSWDYSPVPGGTGVIAPRARSAPPARWRWTRCSSPATDVAGVAARCGTGSSPSTSTTGPRRRPPAQIGGRSSKGVTSRPWPVERASSTNNVVHWGTAWPGGRVRAGAVFAPRAAAAGLARATARHDRVAERLRDRAAGRAVPADLRVRRSGC